MDTNYSIDAGAERWILKTARKHFWRVQRWYDFDDLVQDGYMWWYLTTTRYGESAAARCAHLPKPEERTHETLMSLFMRSFTNHIHDLATSKTRTTDTLFSEMLRADEDEQLVTERAFADSAVCDTHAAALVSCAPSGVKEVLHAYATEQPAACSAYRVRQGGVRESLNDRLCRIAGVDPDTTNLVDQVRSYLIRDGNGLASV